MPTNYVKSKYYPLRLLRNELADRGYIERALHLSLPYLEMTAPSGKKWLTKRSVVLYPFISVAAKQISINKRLAYDFATELGVTTPRQLRAPYSEQELRNFVKMYAPVIVKPNSSSGSKGLQRDITTPEALSAAMAAAGKYSPEILVQQQCTGEEVRFTIIDGEVVSVMLRQMPRIIGDGIHTVRELITEENTYRAAHLQFECLPYPQLNESIIAADFFADESIPPAGKAVLLSKNTMVSGGASVYDIRNTIDDSYVRTALQLATALNPEFMVVDMMIKDYTAPQTDTNYAFIEFNTAPSLRLYYAMRGGEMCDIVKLLADALEKWSKLS